MLIVKDEYLKLLDFSYVVENNLLGFMVTCIGSLEFTVEKYISVEKPFGNKKTREKRSADGREPKANIKPEFCLISDNNGFVGEAAGGEDTKPSILDYSESHQRIRELVEHEIQIGGQTTSDDEKKAKIYFAQKIMCQLFPVFLYLKNERALDSVQCFYGSTAKHKTVMECVFNLLHTKGYIASFPNRPLEYMDYDLNKYGLAIYEINFPSTALNQSWINDNLDLQNAQAGV